jgi:hypothetical protein
VAVDQVLSATFSEAMSTNTVNASSFTVTGPGGAAVVGTVTYVGTTATFTPTTALSYGSVYTATITTGAQSSAGVALGSNYVWSFTTITPPPVVVATVPLNAATGVPLNQVLTATLNEAMNCATLAAPATTFTLMAPGAVAVPGTVSCSGTVATFTPQTSLAVNTIYTATITTGAKDLAGTPLASNFVWAFRTLPAPTAPTVISIVPANLATGIPVNQALSATFSVAMNPATVDSSTFTVTGPGANAVSGVVTYVAAGSVATFKPSTNLAANTLYTATITTGAEDLEGTALAQNFVWTFTTAAAPIVVPPTVISTIPANAATDVPFNQAVSATFSKAMNPATINSTTFNLTGPGVTPVAGLVAYAAIGNTLTFTPTSNLAPGTLFTATVTTGAQDLAGDALSSNYVWTFTTGSAPVVIAPELVSTLPANAATNIPLTQAVIATFSKAMDPLTITTATFQLTSTQGGTPIPATVTYDAVNFVATLTPISPLTTGTSYTATVSGATDLAGNPLGNTGVPNPWHFTTAAAIIPPPIVLGPTISLFGGFGGGAGITNQGINTVINGGDIGTTGVSTVITGFHDTSIPAVGGIYPCRYTETTLNVGQVNGVIDTAAPPPTVDCLTEGTAATALIAAQAALEANTAYLTLQSLPPGTILPTNELGNLTLAPGTYTSASFYDITAGPLTLDAQGDPDAFWIFQMGTYLTVGTPSASESVVLKNGAKASNVFWQVGSAATINYGGGGTMVGTIISSATTTISSPGQSTSPTVTTLNGRALALNAAVTLVNTVINVPAQ